ncbi:hypothetical protein NQ317_006040 [Molorchus minor]|uniref:Uncharacterized protein n=1 Tax=Molorchus minor TaxID=1323400 RepID=A0ABQ9K4P9_9CUCU|nr:hypothetical protein NQ317_006040 [Molorchus minor]
MGASKGNPKIFARGDAEGVSKKLCFDSNEEDQNFVRNGISLQMDHSQLEFSSDDDDEEIFYTPPSSPSLLENEDSDDEFNDTELPDREIFIEGWLSWKDFNRNNAASPTTFIASSFPNSPKTSTPPPNPG